MNKYWFCYTSSDQYCLHFDQLWQKSHKKYFYHFSICFFQISFQMPVKVLSHFIVNIFSVCRSSFQVILTWLFKLRKMTESLPMHTVTFSSSEPSMQTISYHRAVANTDRGADNLNSHYPLPIWNLVQVRI